MPILLDAVFINNGGGETILDILITDIINKNQDYFFLLDIRLLEKYSFIEKSKIKFIKPSILDRHKFYKCNKNKFSSVFTLSNIPPTIRLDCNVYTYFHNANYFNNDISLFKSFNIILFFKKYFIKFFKNNTDKWIVQSNYIKQSLSLFLQINNNILIYPIFNEISTTQFQNYNNRNYNEFKDKIVFFYVSDGNKHKNHIRLIEAFQKHNKNFPNDRLKLTISSKFKKLTTKINSLKISGTNIDNIGIVSKEILEKEYLNSDIFIYPSLNESFGLGLVEAISYGLPIISSDLPYVHEIIEPSYTFNPTSIKDIFDKLSISRNLFYNKSFLKIENKSTFLLDYIYERN